MIIICLRRLRTNESRRYRRLCCVLCVSSLIISLSFDSNTVVFLLSAHQVLHLKHSELWAVSTNATGTLKAPFRWVLLHRNSLKNPEIFINKVQVIFPCHSQHIFPAEHILIVKCAIN
uniref:Secreted protein n=1 Tax=Heterorhabditis bacteriophora TaxID=37862 RepID=A0A1I7W8T1_HETBA